MTENKKKESVVDAMVDGLQLPRNQFVEMAITGIIDKPKDIVNRFTGDNSKDDKKEELSVKVYTLKDKTAVITAWDGKNQYGPARITPEEYKEYQAQKGDMKMKYGGALADKYFSQEIQHNREIAQQQQKTHTIKR